jgi:hypothetical protein
MDTRVASLGSVGYRRYRVLGYRDPYTVGTSPCIHSHTYCTLVSIPWEPQLLPTLMEYPYQSREYIPWIGSYGT